MRKVYRGQDVEVSAQSGSPDLGYDQICPNGAIDGKGRDHLCPNGGFHQLPSLALSRASASGDRPDYQIGLATRDDRLG